MAGRATGFLRRVRTYTGLFSVGAFNLGGLGLQLKSFCAAGFNCHGCPWSTFACPVGVITYGSAVRNLPALAVGLLLTVGLALGRLVCGFFCPFGWLQDLLHKIPSKKFKLPKAARYLKYAALALLVLALPFALGLKPSGYVEIAEQEAFLNEAGDVQLVVSLRNLGTEPIKSPTINTVYRAKADGKILLSETRTFEAVTLVPGDVIALPAIELPDMRDQADLVVDSPESVPQLSARYDLYYCRLCPKGTLTAALPAMLTGSGSGGGIYGGLARGWLRWSILILFLVGMVFVSRLFCRTFCPLGAIYGLLSSLAFARMHLDRDACTNCGACNKVCPVDLEVTREIGGAECIACGDCVGVCPTSAIGRRYGFGNEKEAAKP